MGAPCFPQPNLWLAHVHQCRGQLSRSLLSYPPRNYELEKNHCGRKAWQVLSVLRLRRLLCLFRLAPSCRLRRLARWCEMAQMVSTATQLRYATAMFHSNQPETFPLSAGVSRPYLPSAPNKATETVIFCFGKMFARAAAAAGGSSSSSRRKQQQQEAAAAAGSSGRRRKQQQQEEAAAAGGSSSNRRQQQVAASSSSKQQQAAASSSSKQQQAGASSSKQQQAAARSSKEQQGAATGSNNRQAVGEQ